MSTVEETRRGDKVCLLFGDRKGQRGVVAAVDGRGITVSLGDGTVLLKPTRVQNFSAAARKAWQTRPNRGAGRRSDPNSPRKRMVSLRIKEETWDGLAEAVRAGLIASREAAVNEWLEEKLLQMRSEL